MDLELVKIKLKNKYSLKLYKINKEYINLIDNFSYKKFEKLIKKQNNLSIKIIKEIVSLFDKDLKKYADFVFLNGSYSYNTNIYDSDIDINIMYKDKYRNKLLPIELNINYLLYEVFNYKGCDRMHSIMVRTNLISNDNVIVKDGFIKVRDIKETYYCRENYEKLLFETVNSSRDYKTLIRYFKNNIKNNNIFNIWLYNFKLIKDYGSFNKFIDIIKKQEKNIKNRKDLKRLSIAKIDELISEIDNININSVYTGKYLKIACLKHIFKTLPTDILYEVKTICELNGIDDITRKNILDTLFNIIKIKLVINEFNLDLSSHSSKKILINDFINCSKKYGINSKDELNSLVNSSFIETKNIIKNLRGIISNG